MKIKTTLFPILALSTLCVFTTFQGLAQTPQTKLKNDATPPTIESMPPVVVKTVPESGVTDVAPGEVEIKVTFSKEMRDQSWSWSTAWENSSPESIGKPKYDADQKTCVLKVKLEPNKTYGYWLNSQRFHGFSDKTGHTAVPYLLVFRTKAE